MALSVQTILLFENRRHLCRTKINSLIWLVTLVTSLFCCFHLPTTVYESMQKHHIHPSSFTPDGRLDPFMDPCILEIQKITVYRSNWH